MAMFPPAIPKVFIEWLTQRGDVVYDPFSGRGTTVLEACLAGRVGVGSDANPLAWLLTSAKSNPPSLQEIEGRMQELARKKRRSMPDDTAPADIRMLFGRSVLSDLLWLRTELNQARKVDRYLLATLAGMLHGNANQGGQPRGLSIAMPNTFAMSPGYVRRYIREHKLKPPRVDVLAALSRRLATFPLPNAGFRRGKAWLQDASATVRFPNDLKPAKLVFTSPPYLHVMKYGKFNWVRHWFLGADHRVVDASLLATGSLSKYLTFMTATLKSLEAVLRDDGYCCLVVGDVRRVKDEINLARAIAKECVPQTGLRVLGIVRDSLPVQHKVSRIWGAKRGRATRTDRILILGASRAKRPANAISIEW